jgi:tRNA-binding EMAP/Myf-like protein
MQGKMVLVLANLKPAALRGVKSFGMVLAASNEAHTVVELVEPPAAAKPGDVVVVGEVGAPQPDAQLNAKKNPWDNVHPVRKGGGGGG